jgi:biotin carboxylase
MEDAIVVVDLVSSSLFYKPVIKEMGFKLIAVFTKPFSAFDAAFHISEEKLLEGCDEVIVSDDKDQVIQELKKSKFKIRAAFPGLDSGVALADEITHAFHLHGNPLTHSKARREKGAMRRLLKKEGFPCPDFQACKTEKEIIEFAEAHSFPLVVKTPLGAGTSHVYICYDLDRLVRKFHTILEETDFFGVRADYAIIEEYIGGDEYIVDTFSDGERAHVTDIWLYEKIDSKTFHNIYYNCFSLPLSDPKVKPLIDLACKLADAFDIKRGPAHLEIKDDPKRGPTLVEINARFGGVRIPLLIKESSNFDPYKKTLEVFIHGKTKVPEPIVMKKACAIVCCPVLETGKIQDISGIEKIQKLASYQGHQLNIKSGDLIVPTTDLATIPLIVFMAHADQAQLLKDVERTHALFAVKLAA